jgi:hypothetical protein
MGNSANKQQAMAFWWLGWRHLLNSIHYFSCKYVVTLVEYVQATYHIKQIVQFQNDLREFWWLN